MSAGSPDGLFVDPRRGFGITAYKRQCKSSSISIANIYTYPLLSTRSAHGYKVIMYTSSTVE